MQRLYGVCNTLMIDTLLDAFTAIDQILWEPWTVLFIAGVAVYFTVRSANSEWRTVNGAPH